MTSRPIHHDDPGITHPPATHIANAIIRWLDGLEPAQRARAALPFDTDERFVWAFTPGDREGLPIADMSSSQREAALSILDASMSERGSLEVRAVIALETVLGELERDGGKAGWPRRDPELYWFAVFGEPGGEAPWAWRVGGHHVAINLAVADGRVIGSAPSFLGANPATIPNGPGAGGRALDGEEMLARTLLGSLTPAQRAVAVVDPVAPPEILSGHGRRADVRGVPNGIRHEQLEVVQGDGLERLIRHYLDRVRPDIADEEWERIRSAGLAPVTFAWAGSDTAGRGHYYAIRGPSFLIEYDNTQDGANHIHSVWRDLANDWGEDRLALHYRDAHAAARRVGP